MYKIIFNYESSLSYDTYEYSLVISTYQKLSFRFGGQGKGGQIMDLMNNWWIMSKTNTLLFVTLKVFIFICSGLFRIQKKEMIIVNKKQQNLFNQNCIIKRKLLKAFLSHDIERSTDWTSGHLCSATWIKLIDMSCLFIYNNTVSFYTNHFLRRKSVFFGCV